MFFLNWVEVFSKKVFSLTLAQCVFPCSWSILFCSLFLVLFSSFLGSSYAWAIFHIWLEYCESMHFWGTVVVAQLINSTLTCRFVGQGAYSFTRCECSGAYIKLMGPKHSGPYSQATGSDRKVESREVVWAIAGVCAWVSFVRNYGNTGLFCKKLAGQLVSQDSLCRNSLAVFLATRLVLCTFIH